MTWENPDLWVNPETRCVGYCGNISVCNHGYLSMCNHGYINIYLCAHGSSYVYVSIVHLTLMNVYHYNLIIF